MKALSAVALGVSAVFTMLMAAYVNVYSSNGITFLAFLAAILLALILSLPFYVLRISSRRRLRKGQLENAKSAYLRSCALGLLVVIIVSGRILWEVQDPECGYLACGGWQCLPNMDTVNLLLWTPVILALVMIVAFWLTLWWQGRAVAVDFPSPPDP